MGRDSWPDVCCRKENFEHLKTCNDASGKVPCSRGEIVDVLKLNGYLQVGMNKAICGVYNANKLKTKLQN